MKAKCTHCKHSFSVPIEFIGETVKCPKCKETVEAPQIPTSPVTNYIVIGIMSAALAGMIGFSCGALLTRTNREETKAKIENIQIDAKREINEAKAKLLNAEKEVLGLKDKLRINEGEVRELARSTQKAWDRARKPALTKRPHLSPANDLDSTPLNSTSNGWEIVSIKTKITETNDVFVKYAWRLTVRNDLTKSIRLSGVIEYQDSEGFVVDTDDVYNLVLLANSEKTFTDATLVGTSIAHKIAGVVVKLKQ
jgi:hypothetical protein